MRALVKVIMVVVVILASLAGCGGGGAAPPGPALRGHHAAARILVKKDGGVCKSRTIPKSHVLLKGEEDEIVWDLKVKDGCLDDSDLVLKWVVAGKNPTTCTEITTAANGNKNRIECDLKSDAIGDGFVYKVFLRKGGVDTPIEDPDVEIVMF